MGSTPIKRATINQIMNKEWSNTQKEAMILINKRSTFENGIKKLIWLRTILFNQWINSMKGISKEDYAKMPFPCHKGFESKTIGYSIYHVFRIEDIVLNSLIINQPEIFMTGNYQNKINSPLITTGNELVMNEIKHFSEFLNGIELWHYAQEVYEKSNRWILSLKYDDLSSCSTNLDKERLENLNVVNKKEHWLIDYWCNKNVKGLLAMPFSRHWIMHLEASLRIKRKIIKE